MKKETTINELMEFLQENMVTKEEAKFFATKDDLRSLATDVESLENKVDANFRMLTEDMGEVKEKLSRLETRTFEDTSALVKEILKLDRRLEIIEKKS